MAAAAVLSSDCPQTRRQSLPALPHASRQRHGMASPGHNQAAASETRTGRACVWRVAGSGLRPAPCKVLYTLVRA